MESKPPTLPFIEIRRLISKVNFLMFCASLAELKAPFEEGSHVLLALSLALIKRETANWKAGRDLRTVKGFIRVFAILNAGSSFQTHTCRFVG
jgi:hypothetical protein